jgi:hypothetical protein
MQPQPGAPSPKLQGIAQAEKSRGSKPLRLLDLSVACVQAPDVQIAPTHQQVSPHLHIWSLLQPQEEPARLSCSLGVALTGCAPAWWPSLPAQCILLLVCGSFVCVWWLCRLQQSQPEEEGLWFSSHRHHWQFSGRPLVPKGWCSKGIDWGSTGDLCRFFIRNSQL